MTAANIEPNDTGERLRFREYYRNLTNDDLARLSLDENLVSAARDAITEELDARGLDLSSSRDRFEEEVAAAKAAGVLGGVPSSALSTEQTGSHQLLGLAGLVMFGLVGVHKWLLGDATTWRKEATLAVWLFWALIFTWDPTVRLLKGQASARLVFWLILGWLYFAATAAALAVPALGRVVNGLNPLLVAAIVASPAIVLGLHRVVRRFASQADSRQRPP
jgi:hypothetical protein